MTWGDVGTAITAMGSCTSATLAFRAGGQLYVAAVVKASFALAPDGPMVLVEPDPLVRADQHRDPSPSSSLVAASDLVPHRPRVDVLLSGHARTPLGRPAPAMPVRLMVARGPSVVLDKRLAVRGAPDPLGRTREPSPFAAMPLSWELAVGAPDNPGGIVEGPHRWPHVLDPRRRDQPAGVGPISPLWPSRRRLLGVDERALEAAIPEFPGDFAWEYFNAAPDDQRLDLLRGNEWIVLEGMNAQIRRVQSCLPGVRAVAHVYGSAGEAGEPLPLEADTLSIDADRLRCSVVWRGSFPVACEKDLAGLHILAGVELAEHPLSFPASSPAPPPPARVAALGLDTEEAPTVALRALVRSPLPTLPFAPSGVASREARPESRPAATPFEGARLAPAPSLIETVTLGLATASPVTRRASAGMPATTETSNPTADDSGTVALDVSVLRDRAPVVPFAPTRVPPRRASSEPLPAATPFEGARLTPAPFPIESVTLGLAVVSPAWSRPPATSDAASPAPVRADPPVPSATGTSEAAPAEPAADEPPRTLGATFLAAMARAGVAPDGDRQR